VRIWCLEAVPVARPATQAESVVPVATIAVVGTTVVVMVVAVERVESHTTVSADGLFPTRRFEDWLSNRYRDHVLARAGLVFPRRAGAIARDTALDMDYVRVVVRSFVGRVDNFYVAVPEYGELEGFPLRSFLYLFVSVKYLYE
jgi:hypothetical protein